MKRTTKKTGIWGIVLTVVVLVVFSIPFICAAQQIDTVTNDMVTYTVADGQYTVDRDLLGNALPRANEYQWHGDNLALILDLREWQGQEPLTFPPFAADTLTDVIDELALEVNTLINENESLQTQLGQAENSITVLEQEITTLQASIQPLRDSLAAAEAENTYAITRIRQMLRNIRDQ